MMSKKTPAFAGAFFTGEKGIDSIHPDDPQQKKKRTRDLFKTAGIWKKS